MAFVWEDEIEYQLIQMITDKSSRNMTKVEKTAERCTEYDWHSRGKVFFNDK